MYVVVQWSLNYESFMYFVGNNMYECFNLHRCNILYSKRQSNVLNICGKYVVFVEM